MALTRVQKISNALALLGQKPINSLEGQGELVNTANQAYDFLLTSTLSSNKWRFATRQVQLSLLVDTPIDNRFKYIYQLPADYLCMVTIWPLRYDWEIFENQKLYANFNDTIYAEYIFRPIDGLFPPYFDHYFVYELAVYLALSSAQKPEYYPVLKAERDYRFSVACATDAQSRPATGLQSAPAISNRYVNSMGSF
jgi:hypothetical protein